MPRSTTWRRPIIRPALERPHWRPLRLAVRCVRLRTAFYNAGMLQLVVYARAFTLGAHAAARSQDCWLVANGETQGESDAMCHALLRDHS